ncbi:Major Facilitator Superfamily Vesicular Transporter [Pleurotus pulmonarius]
MLRGLAQAPHRFETVHTSCSTRFKLGPFLNMWTFRSANWRSSYWFVTAVVGLGILTDLLLYSVAISVMPFHLERLGYTSASSLTGWLLFAYSAGVVISTVPTAMLSEPSQVMLMEAPNYLAMVVARLLQGLSSSVIWVVGLALLCDCTPKEVIGRQIGIVMMGFSLGIILGPPLGGLLYDRFGFRGPFVLGIAVAFFDLICRLLIVEPKSKSLTCMGPINATTTSSQPVPITESTIVSVVQITNDPKRARPPFQWHLAQSKPSMLTQKLAKAPRTLSALFVMVTNGLASGTIEPALPLRLQDIWDLNSTHAGVVFIGGLAPSLLSSPISDIYRIIGKDLGMFIALFVFASFFVSATVSPVTAELAAVSRGIRGVGFAHVYGAFNVAYGVGSALGPIIGGQVYDHVKTYGWAIICAFIACMPFVSVPLVFGDLPLWKRLKIQLAFPSQSPRPQLK